jgi:hypothetical protein
MRFRVLLRTLTTTLGLGLLWLAVASPVEAAPGPIRARDNALCEAQHPTSALKRLLRRAKSYGGPLANKPSLSRLGLRLDLTPHFRRVKRSVGNDHDAAIQNDAPAARVSAQDLTVAGLRPIGFFVGHVDSHPRTRAFSPRSPRGPPAAS